MNTEISENTVNLINNITKPLIITGTIHKSEQHAVTRILKMHMVGSGGGQKEYDRNKLVTPSKAAEMLSLSTRTILRMIKAGELEGFFLRKGSHKTLRIKLESIDTLMNNAGRE